MKTKGGEFIIKETNAQDIFIPEQWTEEQLMMKKTCEDFVAQEVLPHLDRIDNQEVGLVPSIMEKAGELGILGISVPEDLGGLGFDFVTSMLTTEVIGGAHSVAVALSAHTGIGTLPILYYGNAEQKKKYIPKLATGEWKACYCLTEPSSGSDANSGKTHAKLTADGKHYILNGQKMWITNGGFADIFTVFAKIDDDKNLSAFIVEKSFGGITLNPEEHKMGIKGSSTRQVFFNDCKVPVENLLSERENGFKIAVNILNIGRIKLAAAAIGASKQVITKSVEYANERNQFGRPISKYGAIRYKLAEQATRTFACESAAYRASQNIEDAILALTEGGMDEAKAKLKGIEQFAVECAILKVHGSEVLDYVVDEGVQIYGGMGYSAEAPMDRAYRDARINRIFEGTNEINRMLIIDMVLKRAMKGELDLMGPAQKVASELMGIPEMNEPDDTLFVYEKQLIVSFKKAILMVAGAAVQKLMTTLSKEQEIIMNIADMAIETYVAESVLLRVEKLVSMRGEEACKEQLAMMRVYVNDACDKIGIFGKEALNSFAEGDELRMMLMGLKRFTKQQPFNAKAARQIVAEKLIAEINIASKLKMENAVYEGKVIWSMVDANMHLRHSAYADFAAQARLEILISSGFNADVLEQLHIGPILFREELIYMREVRPSDTIKINSLLTKCRRDGARWSFTQAMYRSDGIQAAQINVDGAWIDTIKRKLVGLPDEWSSKFLDIPKSADFILEEIPVKKVEPIITTNTTMTPLEEKFEAAKARVMELKEKPSNEKMLELYALNKQATIGDINAEKPAMFDFVAAAKFNAWTTKKGMSKEEAQQKYIDYVNGLF